MPEEELAASLYYVETFIPVKRRSNLQNIQQNFEDSYKKVTNMAFKADDMDNYLADNFGCEFSEYAKKDAI